MTVIKIRSCEKGSDAYIYMLRDNGLSLFSEMTDDIRFRLEVLHPDDVLVETDADAYDPELVREIAEWITEEKDPSRIVEFINSLNIPGFMNIVSEFFEVLLKRDDFRKGRYIHQLLAIAKANAAARVDKDWRKVLPDTVRTVIRSFTDPEKTC